MRVRLCRGCGGARLALHRPRRPPGAAQPGAPGRLGQRAGHGRRGGNPDPDSAPLSVPACEALGFALPGPGDYAVRKDAETRRRFVESMPMREIPARCVLVKPLGATDPERERVQNVTFFTDPDRLSALVVLANYAHPCEENVAIPWAAACQVIGIFAYREGEREHPRALVGLTDLSARKNVRPSLGEHAMSFTVPWSLFLEMEERVEGSFLQRETWRSLGHGGSAE